jgi:hypothetical protein
MVSEQIRVIVVIVVHPCQVFDVLVCDNTLVHLAQASNCSTARFPSAVASRQFW